MLLAQILVVISFNYETKTNWKAFYIFSILRLLKLSKTLNKWWLDISVSNVATGQQTTIYLIFYRIQKCTIMYIALQILVAPLRIELRFPDYQSSVLPFNYRAKYSISYQNKQSGFEPCPTPKVLC